MTIGERIKEFRKNMGITSARLAELSGVHPVAIRKYETNRANPRADTIEKLAAALNVEVRDLKGYSEFEELDDEEQNLIRMYRRLNSKGKVIFGHVVKSAIEIIDLTT